MNSKHEPQGAWIFVSHSNRDIEKVREIRNELERRGHNPVLFFLKCMETTEADDRLLWQLIEREIKAREWFILCDSPNARNSAAVWREMELVKSMAREGKVVETIDLGRDLETAPEIRNELERRGTFGVPRSRGPAGRGVFESGGCLTRPLLPRARPPKGGTPNSLEFRL